MGNVMTLVRADNVERFCEALRKHVKAGPLDVHYDPVDKRTLDQNDRLNAMCGDVAAQVVWHGQMLSRDDWRHMFVAAYRKGQRVVPGIDGGFVVLGASSRKLKKDECSDVIEIVFAFGAEHGVVFKEKA